MKIKNIRLTALLVVLIAMTTGTIMAQQREQRRPNDTSRHEAYKIISPRLTIGGYGEATYQYNFFSDNSFRYSYADRYKDSKGHGRVDLPHVVIMLGYDFGRGWTMGSEIEFEHGGTESAVEIENEETGEYEQEIERGGEVALEQFWLQKSFSPKANLRMGHIVVPVGATNAHHLPTEFFTVFRPEGENTIIPCTWHETGISFWGRSGKWGYEAQLIPSLNSTMFNMSGWAHDGSASAYEFRVANRLALAGRVDYYPFAGLRLSASGFVGNTFNNDIITEEGSRYIEVDGLMGYGSFDFLYRSGRLIARGNVDYGYLNEAGSISVYNGYLNNSTMSPYPHTLVGKAACDAAVEVGVNVLRQESPRQLFLFGRYNYYNSYIPATIMRNGVEINQSAYEWTERNVMTLGFNYYPMREIVIKGEVGYRKLASKYNSEPWVALGIAYSGFFNRH